MSTKLVDGIVFAAADAAPPSGVLEESMSDTPTGTKVPEWTPLVTKFLQSRFGNRYDDLINIIKLTGSLISGGSILSA